MIREWFDRLLARRSVRLSALQSWGEFIGMDGGSTAAGITVTPRRALSLAAVYTCIMVLAQDVAKTPIKLRRRSAPDTFVDAVDHGLWEVLHDLANPETTAFAFKQQMQADLLAHEAAYAQIVRVDGAVSALWRLDPERMTVDRDEARRKRWRYVDERGAQHVWTFDASSPPIFELSHRSPLRYCQDLIATALALQTYVGKFFSNAGWLSGVLHSDDQIDRDTAEEIRERVDSIHTGAQKAWKTLIVGGGLKFQAVTPPNDQAQLNETMQAIATQIAAVFRLPPWKMGITEKTSYSNLEQGAIDYATGTLDPYFVLWEQAIRRDLLTTRQFSQFDVIFDRSTLIRADIKSLYEALSRARDAGIYTADDVRRKLGDNPAPAGQGGGLLLVNGNMKPATEAGRDAQ